MMTIITETILFYCSPVCITCSHCVCVCVFFRSVTCYLATGYLKLACLTALGFGSFGRWSNYRTADLLLVGLTNVLELRRVPPYHPTHPQMQIWLNRLHVKNDMQYPLRAEQVAWAPRCIIAQRVHYSGLITPAQCITVYL